MYTTPIVRSVGDAVQNGVQYLLRRQANDGFWRDYQLPPGISEAWSTAWVGWCLANSLPPLNTEICAALQKAMLAVHSCCRDGGWGYNRMTGLDADSTAWAVRFLSCTGLTMDVFASRLGSFLDSHGRAHTFLESDAGSWGDAHPDVTALVGLALLEARASANLIARVRRAVLDGREPGPQWCSFWWTTPTYATYWSSVFLHRSGGLPLVLRAELQPWLTTKSVSQESAFELSYRLLLALELGLGSDPYVELLVDGLLELFAANKRWLPSAHLLVPAKNNVKATQDLEYPDSEGLMTNAIVCQALSRWLR